MKLGMLMEGFVKQARETTVPSLDGPVQPSRVTPTFPIRPMDRWTFEDKKRLRKRFLFDTTDMRNQFLLHILQYEDVKCHHAIEMKIFEKAVELLIGTISLDTVTDLDKEYCKHADILYKDVCYIPQYEPR